MAAGEARAVHRNSRDRIRLCDSLWIKHRQARHTTTIDRSRRDETATNAAESTADSMDGWMVIAQRGAPR